MPELLIRIGSFARASTAPRLFLRFLDTLRRFSFGQIFVERFTRFL
jgi:hypothetical protein